MASSLAVRVRRPSASWVRHQRRYAMLTAQQQFPSYACPPGAKPRSRKRGCVCESNSILSLLEAEIPGVILFSGCSGQLKSRGKQLVGFEGDCRTVDWSILLLSSTQCILRVPSTKYPLTTRIHALDSERAVHGISTHGSVDSMLLRVPSTKDPLTTRIHPLDSESAVRKIPCHNSNPPIVFRACSPRTIHSQLNRPLV
jgi:hypothetical protein